MSLASLLASTDYFRRSPARAGGARGHKEWFHFCVQQPGLDALVNFNVSDEVDTSRSPAGERAHVVALVHDGNRWLGGVDRHWESDFDIAGGEVHARMGRNRMSLSGGAFRVTANLRQQPLEIDLALEPEAFPLLSNNIRLSADQGLNWVVVPRLRASGVVRASGVEHRVRDALSYHDHNWGRFAWGADFAWEWGYGAPADAACPWSLIFVRLSNRTMTSTRTQALTLWRGRDMVRSFRGRELRASTGGVFSSTPIYKVPSVMALLAPGSATEVPARLTLTADADGDTLTVELIARSVAQIIVPNDRTAGVTTINEVAASLHVFGRVFDEAIDYEGRGMFEVLGC